MGGDQLHPLACLGCAKRTLGGCALAWQHVPTALDCNLPRPSPGCLAAQRPALPPAASLAAGACDASLPGTTCTATCVNGYMGEPTLSCKSNGSGWAPSWTGTCSPARERAPLFSNSATVVCLKGQPAFISSDRQCVLCCTCCPRNPPGTSMDTSPHPLTAACSGTPSSAPAGASVPPSCANRDHGFNCVATCPAGFAGSPGSSCVLASWQPWLGSCTDQRERGPDDVRLACGWSCMVPQLALQPGTMPPSCLSQCRTQGERALITQMLLSV